ncbi:MAG: hypothetical protein V1740_03560 [Candidatus Woesearchaeota archaeon]
MDDNTLKKIAVITSILGIFLLYIFSSNIEIEEKKIIDLSEQDQGSTIKIVGNVVAIEKEEKVSNLFLAQNVTIKAISFDDLDNDIVVGDSLKLIGEYRNYKGRDEMIIDDIEMD